MQFLSLRVGGAYLPPGSIHPIKERHIVFNKPVLPHGFQWEKSASPSKDDYSQAYDFVQYLPVEQSTNKSRPDLFGHFIELTYRTNGVENPIYEMPPQCSQQKIYTILRKDLIVDQLFSEASGVVVTIRDKEYQKKFLQKDAILVYKRASLCHDVSGSFEYGKIMRGGGAVTRVNSPLGDNKPGYMFEWHEIRYVVKGNEATTISPSFIQQAKRSIREAHIIEKEVPKSCVFVNPRHCK